MDKKKIAIFGGGASGLVCALYLIKAGFKVTLYEKSGSIGGKLKTENIDGFILDVGFQIYIDSYSECKKILSHKDLNLNKLTSSALIFNKGEVAAIANPLNDLLGALKSLRNLPGSFGDYLHLIKDVYTGYSVFSNIVPDYGNAENTLTYLNKHYTQIMVENFFKPFFQGVFLDNYLNNDHRFFQHLLYHFAFGNPTWPEKGIQEIGIQLASRIGVENIYTNAEIVINDNKYYLDNKEIIADEYVLAFNRIPDETNYHSAFVLYYYYEGESVLSRNLYLDAHHPSGGITMIELSLFNKNCAPDNKNLISLSITPRKNAELPAAEEGLAIIQNFIGRKDIELIFIKSYHIKNALPIKIQEKLSVKSNIHHTGDYLCMPSLNGAFYSGRITAEKIIDKYN